jgi:hypothetical protein
MTPLLPSSTLGTIGRKWRQDWSAACGAGFILILSSGLGFAFGAAVECLSTPDPALDGSVSVASERQPIPLLPRALDGWYEETTRLGMPGEIGHWR